MLSVIPMYTGYVLCLSEAKGVLTRARYVSVKPYSTGVQITFSVGQVAAAKIKLLKKPWYHITRALHKYLKCLKFQLKSFQVLFDTGLSEGHDLAPKPGDVNPVALRDLLAICDISKPEDAMTLISSLAFQNPKAFEPFRIRPAPYTKAVWKILKAYIPQASILYGLRDFHSFVAEQVQSVRVMKRSYERSVTNALYLGRLILCFLDIMICIDYHRRPCNSATDTVMMEKYKELRDSAGRCTEYLNEFGTNLKMLITKYTNAQNVRRYCVFQDINVAEVLKFVTAPKLRRRSSMLVGTAHCGKTHFTQALGALFDAGSLNLNSSHARDFEIGCCYNRRLVLVDDVNAFGFQNLGAMMSILDGSKGVCNQKYTKITEGVIFPPTLLTANDQNKQITDNYEPDQRNINADSKRLTVILSRINVVYTRRQLTPTHLTNFAYGSLDVLAHITKLSLSPCQHDENRDGCLHCILKMAFDDVQVEGGYTTSVTLHTENKCLDDVTLQFQDASRSTLLNWSTK